VHDDGTFIREHESSPVFLYLEFFAVEKSLFSRYLPVLFGIRSVTPSLPQRGRHPKGSAPLTLVLEVLVTPQFPTRIFAESNFLQKELTGR
jgi:hypothetical protein